MQVFVYTMTTCLHEVVGLVDVYLTLIALYPILECMFSGFSLALGHGIIIARIGNKIIQ